MAPKVIKTLPVAYGWHWRPGSGRLKYADDREPKVGERLVARTPKGRPVQKPRWCKAGFHAARTLKDSLQYKSYGPRLSFVMMEDCQFYGSSGWGVRIRHRQTKFTARYRTVLWEVVVDKDIYYDGTRSDARVLQDLETWLKKKGFNADSMRAMGRRLRARRMKGKKK